MANIFDPRRKEDTEAAHQWALEQIYPRIFGADYQVESVVYNKNQHNDRSHAFDCLLGVDSVVHLSVSKPAPEREMIITVQERFRDKKYHSFQDITVTDGNNKTGLPSESTKLAAHLFIYGYVDKEQEQFVDGIAVDVSTMVIATHKRLIIPSRNPGNGNEQPFLSFKFNDLRRIKAVKWHMATEEQYEVKDLLLSIHRRLDEQAEQIEKLNHMMVQQQQATRPRKTSFGAGKVVSINGGLFEEAA